MNTEQMSQPAPRLPLEMQIEFRRSYGRQSEHGLLKNISISGAYLSVDESRFRANDKIIINFEVSGRRRKITAHVVWSNSKGCGVKFLPFNNRDVQIVDDLMYFVESQRKTRQNVLENIFKKIAA